MIYFAEYLPRVGVVNITSSEKAISFGEKSVEFTDGTSFALPHEILPTQVSAQYQDNIYTFRCKALGGKRLNLNNGELFSRVKWDREFFGTHPFTLKCKCGNLLIESTNYNNIADMPSEYWHELMDLWHCHKPDIISSEQTNFQSSIIYTNKFNNEFSPEDNQLLLGDSYIMLKNKNLDVHKGDGFAKCGRCLKSLGVYKEDQDYVKFFKWKLSLQMDDVQTDVSYLPRDFVVQSLINAIDSLGTRLFEIVSPSGSSISVWCFDLGLTIGLPNGDIAQNRIKILYKDGNVKSTGNQNVECISVPHECFEDFTETLENTHEILKDCLNKEWKISYI